MVPPRFVYSKGKTEINLRARLDAILTSPIASEDFQMGAAPVNDPIRFIVI
jgi:hypothetical protein